METAAIPGDSWDADGIGPSLEYTVTPRLALDDSGAIQQDGAPGRSN